VPLETSQRIPPQGSMASIRKRQWHTSEQIGKFAKERDLERI